MIGQSQHYVLGIVMPQNVEGVHVNVRAMRGIGLNEGFFPILRDWWIRLGPQEKRCRISGGV